MSSIPFSFSTSTSYSFIHLIKKTIPFCSLAITKTHHHVHVPALSISTYIISNRTKRTPHNHYPLASYVSGQPPEFPSRRQQEVDPGATPPELPVTPNSPPDIDPSATPDEFIQTPPPGEIGPPPPPPDPTPNPPGPGFPQPPIPSPPGPDVVPPPLQPPPGPDIVPPEVIPPQQPPPPEITPPGGPVIL